MSSTDENVAHSHNRILLLHETINISLVLLPVAVMKHWPKATKGEGLFFILQVMSVIEGVGGGNSSRRVKQKTGRMAAWWLAQVHAQLAFSIAYLGNGAEHSGLGCPASINSEDKTL